MTMLLAAGVALLATGRFRLAAGIVPAVWMAARAELRLDLRQERGIECIIKDCSFASIDLRLSVDIKSGIKEPSYCDIYLQPEVMNQHDPIFQQQRK